MEEKSNAPLRLFSQLQSDPIPTLIALLYEIPAILIALTLHELAHGYVALRCGDPTAQMLGRLSFNPLRHLDPIGTLCMLLFGVGWAKPVPVNPRNFKHFRRDDLLVSLAGIVMNFLLFLFAMLVMLLLNQLIFTPELWKMGELTTPRDFLSFEGWNFSSVFQGKQELFLYARNGYGYYTEEFSRYVRVPWLLYLQRFFMNFAMVNLGLSLFNLLPVPPLDGYHVANDIFAKGKLRISQKVMNILVVALLVICFATDFFSSFISQALIFVQGGVLDALLWIFGLG